jgi:hypothetical protein
MDLLGNLANLKVDTVLSAVDKYVPGKFQLLEVQTWQSAFQQTASTIHMLPSPRYPMHIFYQALFSMICMQHLKQQAATCGVTSSAHATHPPTHRTCSRRRPEQDQEPSR